MKSRVITFCVFYICSELVASIPYPEELASLLRAYSASGAPSNNDFSNPLELPNVARSHNYGDSDSLREFSGTRSFEQGNGGFDYNPSFSRPQSRDSSSTLNNLYDRSRIQQRNNDYGKYVQQSQSSLSELTLQRELEKQQQAALQNRIANQFIQTGGLEKLISNRDISSEISPPQIKRVSDAYVDSLPLETLLQQAKRVETVPIRSPLVQKTVPVLNDQPSSLLDKFRPTHLNTRKSASQGYENIQQAVGPIVFGKQQYLQVPQGTGKKPVIDDARIKEILGEVEIAKKIGNSGYRDIVIGDVNTKGAKTGMENVLPQSKATAQAIATTSKKGGNQKQLPGSLTEIFSHLNLNQNKPGPIPEILNGSVSITKPPNTEETKPKENDRKKKRYLIIHPNGTREYVNTIDSFVKNNSNYVLYTTKNLTQDLKVGYIPANNPNVLHTEVATNTNSKATVAPISKNIDATKTVTLPAKAIKTVSAVAVATNSVLPTKQQLPPKIINKVVLDGNSKKNATVPKPVPVMSTPSRPVSAAAVTAATANASVLPGKSVGLGSNQTLKPIIKPGNPLLTPQSLPKASTTLSYQKKLPHGKVNSSKPLYVSEIIIYEIDPLTMKPKIISDTIEEISKPNTTKPTNNRPHSSSTSTASTTTSTTSIPSTKIKQCTTDATTTTSSTTTQPTTTTSTTIQPTITTSTTTQPTTTTSTTTTSTTRQPTTTTSKNTKPTTTSTTTQPTTTTSTTTQPTTTTCTSTKPTTTSTTTQPTTTTSTTTQPTTTTCTSTKPTTTSSTTKQPTTTTSTTTQPTTTTSTKSSSTTSSTTTSTTKKPTTKPTTTKTTTEKTTTSKPDNSTPQHHITAYRVGKQLIVLTDK